MTQEKENAGEHYIKGWITATIHLNPETGEMHSDGNHAVRHWITKRTNRLASYDKLTANEQTKAKDFRADWLRQHPNIIHIPSEHEDFLMAIFAVCATAAQQKRIEELEGSLVVEKKWRKDSDDRASDLEADGNAFAEWASMEGWVFDAKDGIWWSDDDWKFGQTSELRTGPYAEWREKQKKGGEND